PDQSELLARPEIQEDVAAPRLFRERLADREHGRRSRRVVVGAVMNPARVLLAGERHAVAAVPQVIVMRSEGHPWLRHPRRAGGGGGRKVAGDVVAGLPLAFDGGAYRHARIADIEAG